MYKDMHAQIISSIKNLQLDAEDPRKLLQSWGRLRFPRHVLQKSKSTKQKQIIPKKLLDSQSLKFIVSLTLHDRTTKSLLHLNKKKKPPSISAQFQTSLTKLLETLNKAEPFFIRCIRSNAEKKEMHLDETLVVQQLRYTGMLETVRIRRSGYGAKYTFQDFFTQFRVLLPKNASATKEVISTLLEKMGLDPTTYQIGKTKVFLKELERQQLQDTLHKEVMRKIIFLQRWVKAQLQRKYFLEMRKAAIVIQRSWRRYCEEERRRRAATVIQALWRGHLQRIEYKRQRKGATKIQALVRGHSARRRCQSMREEKRKKEEEEREAQIRLEEEEQRRREEEERRRQQEEDEARKKAAEEEARRKAEEEEELARRTAEEEARKKLEEEACKKLEEEERARLEPRTREDSDIELVTEEALDQTQDSVEEAEDGEITTGSRDAEGGEELPLSSQVAGIKGTEAEAGPQPQDNKENTVTLEDAACSDKPKPLSTESVTLPTNTENTQVKLSESNRSHSAIQEKREKRRRRGLEHNRRETERAAAPPHHLPVKIKIKEDKSGKKEEKPSQTAPVRPSTLPLQSLDHDTNGFGESAAAVNLQRRPGAIKEKPEKWKGRRSDDYETVTLPVGRNGAFKRQLMESTSSSFDSISPTSEGAGALCPRELSLSDSQTNRSTGSSFRRRHQDSGHPDPASTPDKSGGFFSKILKKRPQKEVQTPDDGEITPSSSEKSFGEARPISQPHGYRSVRGRNPTIQIGQVTSVSEQWNASLDREITNANELRHLDDFYAIR
ncbi:hypothetical protein WMY93_025065 [Mugilogobius chulae]|uniref:Myosin motor domain-containing protein n=1 Tax=Mugilogobius chulae TaxID=88201 RepID=A0AAW0NBV6_9GOBI